MMRILALAAAATLAAAPLLAGSAAFAEDNPSAKNMKGPPNANGYGKEKMGETTIKGSNAGAKDMKGPPNAIGYDKK